MKDYLIEVKIKNNMLAKMMAKHGIETSSDLSRKSGVSVTSICAISNLKLKLFSRDGYTKAYVDLALFFGCEPKDLVPTDVYYQGFSKNMFKIEADKEELLSLQSQEMLLLEDRSYSDIMQNNEKLSIAFKDLILSKRYMQVVEYTAVGLTLDEIGKNLNVTRERVRQMQNKAFLRIRQNYIKNIKKTPANNA